MSASKHWWGLGVLFWPVVRSLGSWSISTPGPTEQPLCRSAARWTDG